MLSHHRIFILYVFVIQLLSVLLCVKYYWVKVLMYQCLCKNEKTSKNCSKIYINKNRFSNGTISNLSLKYWIFCSVYGVWKKQKFYTRLLDKWFKKKKKNIDSLRWFFFIPSKSHFFHPLRFLNIIIVKTFCKECRHYRLDDAIGLNEKWSAQNIGTLENE